MVLSVVRKLWSTLSVGEINRLRDIIREELEKIDPRRYKIRDFQAVGAVFEDLAASTPQLWAT
jgi:hypothetical protein